MRLPCSTRALSRSWSDTFKRTRRVWALICRAVAEHLDLRVGHAAALAPAESGGDDQRSVAWLRPRRPLARRRAVLFAAGRLPAGRDVDMATAEPDTLGWLAHPQGRARGRGLSSAARRRVRCAEPPRRHLRRRQTLSLAQRLYVFEPRTDTSDAAERCLVVAARASIRSAEGTHAGAVGCRG